MYLDYHLAIASFPDLCYGLVYLSHLSLPALVVITYYVDITTHAALLRRV